VRTRRELRSIPVFVGCVLLVLRLLGCGSDEDPTKPGTSGDQTISCADPQPEFVMTASFLHDDGIPYTREVVVNQILLMFAADVSAQTARTTVAAMVADQAANGLTLVGQMPRVGMYQFEINNAEADPEAAVAVLEAVITVLSGYPDVEQVSYNELLEARFAENEDDNTDISEYNRAAHGMIDYYQAIPVFDAILSHTNLNPVKVAILDSGIDLETGQFDEIQSFEGGFEYLDLAAPEAAPMDIQLDKHGTAVASIVAADNGDGIVNGIALRVLGDNLSLFVVNNYGGGLIHQARMVAAVEEAVAHGARIVNISQGRNSGGRTPRWLRNLQDQFMRIFTAPGSQDILFVCAASNDRLELDGNDAPAGLPAPNVITVGGLLSSIWDAIYPETARGPGIDIAAPATEVGVCCGGNVGYGWGRRHLSGNSFAAPIVSAIAAIVLSIDPGLSGAELKDFLIDPDHTYPAPEEVGGRRPALLKTAGTAWLELGAPSNPANDVLDCLYGFNDDLCDPPGHVINRLVGAIDFSVAGPSYERSHSLSGLDLHYTIAGYNFGIIQEGSFVVNLANGDEILNIAIDETFELGRTYTIPADGGFQLGAGGAAGDYTGFGTAGSLTFSACEITGRSVPLDNFVVGEGLDVWEFIEVAGTLTGGVAVGAIASDPPLDDVTYTTSGSFTTAFLLLGPGRTLEDYLEEACLGGYRYEE